MKLRRLTASAASLLALGLSACADPPPLYGDAPATAGNNTMVPETPKPDLAMDPYPGGPYGVAQGDTVDDIDLPGYRLSLADNDIATVPWEDSITLASVRSQSNAKCIWLAFDAYW